MVTDDNDDSPALSDLSRVPDLVDSLREVAREARARADRCDAVADELTALAWAGAVERVRLTRARGTLGRGALASERGWVVYAFLRRAWPWRRRVRVAWRLLLPWWP